MMHTSLGGAVGHDPYAPCSEADLLGHGYDYWALGHIHRRFERRSESALAVMPGIPQGRHARENGRGSATLVEIDGSGVRTREIRERSASTASGWSRRSRRRPVSFPLPQTPSPQRQRPTPQSCPASWASRP
jgi:DNA repair exonuclease SbcCD nuclease subunit